MKRKRFVIFLVIVFVVTILVMMIPPPHFERSVEIHAPDSVVKATTERFKTYLDSSIVALCRFDYKTHRDSTRLTWVFTPSDMDDPFMKIFWFYKKSKWQTDVMDRGLTDIKKASEGGKQ